MNEGNQVYVVGKKSNYNSNDGIIRIIPTMLLNFENVAKSLKGELYIKLTEKEINIEFAKKLRDLFKENPGKFGLHIIVQTVKFKQLNLISNRYKIFPSESILDLLEGKLDAEPKIVLDY